MKTRLFSLFFLMILGSGVSQTLEVLGKRMFNPNNWDIPLVKDLYLDSNNNIYAYIQRGVPVGQPSSRNFDLLRYDPLNNAWDIVIDNDNSMASIVAFPQGVIGQKDGSVIAVGDKDTNDGHFVYTIEPDGEIIPFGVQPDFTGRNAGSDIKPVQDPTTGDLYYSHNLIDITVERWDGTQWTTLPAIVENISGGSSSGIGIDEEGAIYVVYRDPSTGNRVSVVIFNETTNSWDELYRGSDIVNTVDIDVISSDEIYVTSHNSTNGVSVVHYDGSDFTQLGETIPSFSDSVIRPVGFLRTAVGDLYINVFDPDNGNNAFYVFNRITNDWDQITNNILGGGTISGFLSAMVEIDGAVVVGYNESNAITFIKYTPNILSTQEEEIKKEVAFTVYPNPTDNFVTIKTNISLQQFHISILDISGKKISEVVSARRSGELQVDFSSLSKGIYIIEVEEKKTANKLIKRIVVK
ncbi:T9SS type A sorting domain-containing protein [Aquimarina sp. RZ0]|uniref:T9SS type A sorting domain-containing protein n=1 Tax=Aquimarina sp. RZ0 TaxID=2607730 RepID=UPI0011F2E6A6|nr:T9SS type A sorting domain-containing protein [Aquimarina sp. RZ0]KAA1244573.1 T9SS type A sorting domain-containing protein [Aquimarina sp. RZ0]